MKKFFSLLLLMVAATVGLQSQAAMFLVGDAFNGWNESGNVQMTQDGNIYSWSGELAANKYFAFFKDSEGWNYQRGPARGNDSAPLGDWEDTTSGGAWKTTAAGTYTIEYDYSTDKARIVVGTVVEPDPFDADALTFVATGEAVGGWNMPPTVVFTKNNDGTHSLEIDATAAEFKIAGVKDYSNLGWGDFDAGVYGGATLAVGDNTLTAGETGNMTMPQGGTLVLTISDVTETSCKLNIAVKQEAEPAYYLVGEFSGWSESDDYKFVKQNDGSFELAGIALEAETEFKIKNEAGKWLGGGSEAAYEVHSGWCDNLPLDADLAYNFKLTEGGTLTFKIADGKLFVSGFDEPAAPELTAVRLTGSYEQPWGEQENFQFTANAQGGGWNLSGQRIEAGFQFKLVGTETTGEQSADKWYGAADSQGDYWITANTLGTAISLAEGDAGQHFFIEKGGEYTFDYDPAAGTLTVIGTIDEDPVVEIAAVELLGSSNEWAEPLGTFAAEDASTGYWTLNDVAFAANDEFKIHVRYTDQSEKWYAPVSDGNFLMNEELLGQELTLAEGGAANIYVVKAATLSFALAPAFDKLVITGEFEAEPEPELTAVRLTGSYEQPWGEQENFQFTANAQGGGWNLSGQRIEAGFQFKLVGTETTGEQSADKWYGAADSQGDYWITANTLGTAISLAEGDAGQHFFIEKGGEYTFDYDPAAGTLTVIGTIDEDPVVEIAAVELLGSSNEWAEPLGTFAAEDASTGYWTLNEMAVAANDEFKIRVRYTDQSEKWYAPVSDGNFLLNEELLGQELTLAEGGAANIYVEKAAKLSFALAPAFDKLVITGEFEAEPVVEIAAVELLGSSNEWAEPLGAFAAEDASTGYWTLNDVEFAANAEFKIRVRYTDQSEKWYAPVSEGNFLLNEELLGQELTLAEGGAANIYVEKAAKLSFALAPAFDKLVITGEFEAEPVAELVSVSIEGGLNADWSETFSLPLALNEETGKYEVAEQAVAAGAEFKVVARYSDQSEKWLSPASEGNFLVNEEQLNKELALAEGNPNMYVEKAGTLSFAVAADLANLVITGEFEAEPVAEIAAVELLGSSNEWAEPLGAFAAEDASTGYWTLNDVEFAANAEFKIRVRYTDQSEKWYAPVSEGNFLLNEELLGQELTLAEGGAANIYVEKAAKLSFALAPAFDKLVITGEFEAEPVVEIAAVELLGSSNEWAEPLGAFAAEDASTGYWTLNDVEFAANAEFKIRVRYTDQSEKWYAPVSDGNFLLNEELLGQELTLAEGGAANIYVEKAAKLSFALAPAFDKLVITGEFEAEPVAELVSVSIEGGLNADWSETFSLPLALNEETGKYEVAEQAIAAGAEFKVVARYSDQSEKWLSPASEGNFLVNEEQLNKELALAEGNPNMYVEKAGTLSFAVAADLANLVITGEFEAEPVVEIAAVELLGSSNEWAEPLGAFAAEDASTGYWTLNDVEFAANAEFKIRVRYTDQSEKWYAPVSDGNFLLNEELLGQELTLAEGGAANIYVEKAAKLSFALAPAFDKLVITGEFEAEPVAELVSVSIEGGLNADWSETFSLPLALNEETGKYEVAEQAVAAGAEFKVVARYSDQSEKWLSPASEGNFLVNEEQLNKELALAEGNPNMYVEKAGTLSFAVAADMANLVITGEFEAEPVVEIAAVELLGSSNEWAEPLGAFAAEDASTGYWTLNDVEFAANAEFKIRVRYTDQSEKWYAPVSDGNFLLNEELLGQELTLAEGGAANIYVEKAAKLSFSLNPAFTTLVVTGEFNDGPVGPKEEALYVIGEVDGHSWSAHEGSQMLVNNDDPNIFSIDVTTAGEHEGWSFFSFTGKLADAEITDEAEAWAAIADHRYGAVSEGDFVVWAEYMGQELDLEKNAEPKAFKIPAGSWNIIVDLNKMKVTINGDYVEPVEPIYVIGNVAGEWDPTQGVAVEGVATDEGVQYSGELEGVDSGDGWTYFAFSQRLAADNEGWDEVAAYRLGPDSEGDFLINADQLDNTIALYAGNANSFKVPAGSIVNYVVTRHADGAIDVVFTGELAPVPAIEEAFYVIGQVDGKDWSPYDGVQMLVNNDDPNIFSIDISAEAKGEDEYAFIGFTGKLADAEIADENEAWASIADHRYGAVAEGDFLLTEELIGQEIDFVKGGSAIQLAPGFWNVIVDLNKKKVTFFQREGNPLDVNHDGYVNVGDVNVILNAILEEVYDPALDVNADGYVNVGDVNVILAYINEHA